MSCCTAALVTGGEGILLMVVMAGAMLILNVQLGLIALVGTLALAACGEREPRLYNLTTDTGGPDEFAIRGWESGMMLRSLVCRRVLSWWLARIRLMRPCIF